MCCSDLQRIYTANFSCYVRVRFIVTRIGNLMNTPEIKYLRKDWSSYLVGNPQRRRGSSLSVDTSFRSVFGSIVIDFSIKRDEKDTSVVLDF